MVFGSTAAVLNYKIQITEGITKKVMVGYLNHNDLSSQEFRKVFQKDSLIEQCIVSIQINQLSDLNKLVAPIVILVGHGEPDGFQIGDEKYEWDELNLKNDNIIILAMCYSSEASINAIKFPGILDARLAAEFSRMIIYSALGYNKKAETMAFELLQTEQLIDMLFKPQFPLSLLGEWHFDWNIDIMLNYKFIMGLVTLIAGGMILLVIKDFSPIDFLYAIICYLMDEFLDTLLSFIPDILVFIKDIVKTTLKAVVGGVLYYFAGPAEIVYSTLKGSIVSFIGSLVALDILAPIIFNIIKWGIQAINAIFPNPILEAIAGVLAAYATYSGYKDIKSEFIGVFEELKKAIKNFMTKIGASQITPGPLMAYTLAAVSGDLASAICSFLHVIGVKNLDTTGLHFFTAIRFKFFFALFIGCSVMEGGFRFDPITFPDWSVIFKNPSSSSGGGGGGGGGSPKAPIMML